MSENVKEKQKSSKTLIIILLIIILLLLAAGIVAAVILLKKDDGAQLPDNGGIIQYEAGVVNLEDAQKVMDELSESAKNGNMIVSYKGYAYSKDGKHFECSINNNIGNEYDMYINIYKDSSFEEQILLTGLIPPGSGIEEFDSEIKLDPGEYETTLVFTQVEDDHSTIHAQSMVVLRLIVEE